MGDVKWVGNTNGSMNAPTLKFTNSSATALTSGDVCFFTSGELTLCTDDLATVAVVVQDGVAASATNVNCWPIGEGNIFRADYVVGDSGCVPGAEMSIAVTSNVFQVQSDGSNNTLLCIGTDTTAGTADFIALTSATKWD